MIKEEIKKLEKIIDREIEGYKHIEKLYVDKKELLIKGKATDLFSVDEAIQNHYKTISNISDERKKATKNLGFPTFSITDIANQIREQDAETAKKLDEKRDQVQELAKSIFQLEKVNLELLKHGMHVSNKTLEIILKGLKPITKEYNQKGRNITKEQLEMSSIVEEA